MKYKVTAPPIPRISSRKRIEWCEENVGERYKDWLSLYDHYSGEVDYFFLKEENAILFALRWLGQEQL